MPMSPAIKRLTKRNPETTAAMVAEVRRARRNISNAITRATRKMNAATSAGERKRLFDQIENEYKATADLMDAHLKDLLDKTGRDFHTQAAQELIAKRRKSVVDYDPERTKKYFDLVRPGTSKALVGVFTDQMSGDSIRTLRAAWVEVFRKATVDGMTQAQMSKALQKRWDELADDDNAFRFRDRSGRAWSNEAYIAMLVRTNAARIATEAFIDTLTEAGFKYARISNGSAESCDKCKKWEGRILQVAGKGSSLPTYEQARADGCFHPNCIHQLEYVDEEFEKADIKRQIRSGFHG